MAVAVAAAELEGGYNNFVNDFRGNDFRGNNNDGFSNGFGNGFGNGFSNGFSNEGNVNFPDLNSNIVNLNDVAVDIPLPPFHSNNSKPNSRVRSPALSHAQTPLQNLNARPSASASASASAQLVFANSSANASSLQTPVSSSPVSALRLQEHDQNNNAASSRLSTPQLLASFQQSQQPHNEVINADNGNGNEMSLVIDIPDANFDDANNNNANNSNLNLNTEPGPESSPGSQLGSM